MRGRGWWGVFASRCGRVPGGLGAGAEEEWKPKERRQDPLWALIARDLFLLSLVQCWELTVSISTCFIAADPWGVMS